MANIKSYSDLEQSMKLAEILPLESADACYNDGELRFGYIAIGRQDYIPCWSLSALLGIMPLEVSINKQTDGVNTYYYIASYNARYCDVYSHRHINVIDACVELIVKLNELKLL